MKNLNNHAYISNPLTEIDMADVYGLNSNISKDEYMQLRKVNLNGLLNSYADEADVFCEIIQNAFDTIQICLGQQKYEAGVTPTIKIFIGKRANDTHYLAVNDNGLGMDAEMMDKFTIPGYTRHKKRGKTVGYKGVGASFFFASSERITIKTIDVKGIKSEMTVKGSYSWIMNETAPSPVVEPKSDLPKVVIDNITEEQGTTVCYYFHPAAKPKNLSNIVKVPDTKEKELNNWISFLCSKTALGQTYDISKDNIKVQFFLDDGNTVTTQEWKFKDFKIEAKTLGYPFPWRVFANCIEKTEIDNKMPAQLIKHLNMNQAIHGVWKKNELEELKNIKFTEDEIALINEHLDYVDVFYCWSVNVLTEVNDRLGAFKSKQAVRYGIKLIVDGIPQGRMIDFDTTSDQGLGRQTHMAFSFRELKLDDGRKIASDENVQEVIRKISVRLMGIIKEYKPYLKKKPLQPVADDLEKWKNDVKNQITGSIVKILFEKLNKIPPISINPNSENDVIALFTSLISNGILKGYKLMAISGYARYDGLINIEKTDDKLRDTSDPFSIRDFDTVVDDKLKVIEFKQQFVDLIEDFVEKKTKYPAEIDLAVCWSLPQLGQNLGEITYCYADRKDYRPLYGVTHIWKNDFNTIPIISLYHFVANYLAVLEEGNPGIGTAVLAELLQNDTEHSI